MKNAFCATNTWAKVIACCSTSRCQSSLRSLYFTSPVALGQSTSSAATSMTRSGPNSNLARADLPYTDLTGANLSYMKLGGTMKPDGTCNGDWR